MFDAALIVLLGLLIPSVWGADTDKKTAKSLLATFGLGTGARIAVNNRVKVIPGCPSRG